MAIDIIILATFPLFEIQYLITKVLLKSVYFRPSIEYIHCKHYVLSLLDKKVRFVGGILCLCATRVSKQGFLSLTRGKTKGSNFLSVSGNLYVIMTYYL